MLVVGPQQLRHQGARERGGEGAARPGAPGGWGAPLWRGVPIVHPGGQAAGKREKLLGRRRLKSCRVPRSFTSLALRLSIRASLGVVGTLCACFLAGESPLTRPRPPAPLYERATPPRRVTGACHAAAGQLYFPLQSERGRWFETPAGRRCRGRPSSC